MGFQKVRIEPEPDKRLGWISAEYHSVSGTFRAEWKYLDERQVQFGISVPDGATAYFKLPGDVQVQELESGEHKIVRRLRSGT